MIKPSLLTLPRMADGSDMTMRAGQGPLAPKQSPGNLVAGIKAFAAAHGGAKAVIEFAGRRGARIVLVGGDGEWGDQFAASTDVARRACEKAGSSWKTNGNASLSN